MREAKYQWLLDNNFDKNYTEIRPASPEYFSFPETSKILNIMRNGTK